MACIACSGWTAIAAAHNDAPAAPPPAPQPIASAAPAAGASGEHEVLVRSNVALGGYGGPDLRISSMLSQPMTLVGVQASWIAGHRILFGAAGYGLASGVDTPSSMYVDGNPSRLGLVYGGIRLGLVATPNSLLHVTMATLIGPGTLSGISRVPTPAEFEVGYERRIGHAEGIFVVEPEVAVEVNLTTFMRVALGASYRYVTGISQPGLSSANLSSPAASLAFKLGVF
jgi:hypothetical protein